MSLLGTGSDNLAGRYARVCSHPWLACCTTSPCLVSYASRAVVAFTENLLSWQNLGSGAVLPRLCKCKPDKCVRVRCAATSTVEGGRRQCNLPALPAGAHPYSLTQPAAVALPLLAVPHGVFWLRRATASLLARLGISLQVKQQLTQIAVRTGGPLDVRVQEPAELHGAADAHAAAAQPQGAPGP